MDRDTNSLLDGIKAALRELGATILSSGSRVVQSATGFDPSAVVGKTADSLTSLTHATMSATQAVAPFAISVTAMGHTTDAAAAVMRAAADKLPIGIDKAMLKIIDSLEKQRAQINEAGKQGLGDNNFTKLNAQAALAGMSVADFGSMIKNATGALNGIGYNASQVGKNLADFSDEMQRTSFSGNLKAMGMEPAELTRIGVITLMNSKANLANTDVLKRAAHSAGELADQMEQTSLLTGKSRTVLADEMESREKSGKGMLASLLLSDDQRVAFEKTQVAMSVLGDDAISAAANIATNQRLDEQTKQTFVTFGGEGTAMITNAVKAQQEAAKTGVGKEEADKRLAAAIEQIQKFQQSEGFAKMGLSSADAGLRAAAERAVTQGAAGRQQRAARIVSGKTPEEIAEENRRISKGLGPSTGEIDPGQVAQRAFNEINERARVLGAGLTLSAKTANDELGKMPGILDSISKTVKELMGTATTPTEASAQQVKTATAVLSPISNLVNPQQASSSTPSENAAYQAEHSDGHYQSRQHRSTGTLGETGQLFEPADFIGKIHKGETVLTPAQFSGIINQVSAKPTADTDSLSAIASSISSLNLPSTDSLSAIASSISSFETASSAKPTADTDSLSAIASSMSSLNLPSADSLSAIASSMSSFETASSTMFTDIVTSINAPDSPSATVFSDMATDIKTALAESNRQEAPVERTPAEPPTPVVTETGALGNLQTSLDQLNRQMAQLLGYTEMISISSRKGADMAAKATGNRAYV